VISKIADQLTTWEGEADFRRLHERLLEEVGDFLSKLLHRI